MKKNHVLMSKDYFDVHEWDTLLSKEFESCLLWASWIMRICVQDGSIKHFLAINLNWYSCILQKNNSLKNNYHNNMIHWYFIPDVAVTRKKIMPVPEAKTAWPTSARNTDNDLIWGMEKVLSSFRKQNCKQTNYILIIWTLNYWVVYCPQKQFYK